MNGVRFAAAVLAFAGALRADARAATTSIANPDGAPFTIYNCRAQVEHDLGRHWFVLGSYFTNVSGKDIVRYGVRFTFFGAHDEEILGFNVLVARPVTAGTKNSIEFTNRTAPPSVERTECSPVYAKFSDGTEWKGALYTEERILPASTPSPQPSAAPSPVASTAKRAATRFGAQ